MPKLFSQAIQEKKKSQIREIWLRKSQSSNTALQEHDGCGREQIKKWDKFPRE